MIVSASSDIGFALAKSWTDSGFETAGTYRKPGDRVGLSSIGVLPIRCELTSRRSVMKATTAVAQIASSGGITTVVFSAGVMDPIGLFGSVPFGKWAQAFEVNFLSQARFLHQIMENLAHGARVVFFAGGGTNNAPTNYSAYILSKITTIKFCELMSKEYPDYSFVSLGPGWVDTKIHRQTIAAGQAAGENLERTISRISTSETVPMELVIEKINQVLSLDKNIVSGRNFSLANDPIDDVDLVTALSQEDDLFTLRRRGNDRFKLRG